MPHRIIQIALTALYQITKAPEAADKTAQAALHQIGAIEDQSGMVDRVLADHRAGRPIDLTPLAADTDCISLLADLDAGKPVQQEAAATLRRVIAERDAAIAVRAEYEAGWLVHPALPDDPDWTNVHIPGLKLYIVTTPSGGLHKVAAFSEEDAYRDAIKTQLTRPPSALLRTTLSRYAQRLQRCRRTMAYAVERFGMWEAPTAQMEEALRELREEARTLDHLLTEEARKSIAKRLTSAWAWRTETVGNRTRFIGRYGDYVAVVEQNQTSHKWAVTIDGGHIHIGFETLDQAQEFVVLEVADRIRDRLHHATNTQTLYGKETL